MKDDLITPYRTVIYTIYMSEAVITGGFAYIVNDVLNALEMIVIKCLLKSLHGPIHSH